MQTINYFISENYIPHWSIQDAYREIMQNFIDYGEYHISNQDEDNEISNTLIENNFSPNAIDLLIIGESNKSGNQIGKYGEGLKMAALVLLRNGYNMKIYSKFFSANFILITNSNTNIKTLGVELYQNPNTNSKDIFEIGFTSPINTFKNYCDTIIKPKDILHTREGFGNIVNREKGNLYVGGLYVCNLPKLNYSYDLLPKNISLDRDRKVPKDFDVKWSISKIQETYEEFDPVGKSADVEYANIPENYIPTYTPRLKGNNVVFTTKIIREDLKEEEVEVSDRFKEQLLNTSFFEKAIYKLKSIVANALGIPELAFKFRNNYCSSAESKRDFEYLMLRLGVKLESEDNIV